MKNHSRNSGKQKRNEKQVNTKKGIFIANTELKFVVQDDLWKESLNVLKLAVSSCSQLEMPAQRPSSVMFDSTWSLDQSVARQELPGKTLDFTFDVSSTPVSTQEGQEAPQKGLAEASGWKRPQLSQVLLPDRFCCFYCL